MRITHQMLSRNFNNRMDTNRANLTRSNDRMASQRAFEKSYENVTDAGKALKIRKLIDHNDRYLTTIRDVQGRAAAAEESLRTVTSLLTRTQDRVIAGLNGTMSDTDRGKLASEVEAAQKEVFQLMNIRFSDNFVFNASGTPAGGAPFTLDGTGQLLYNGQMVDDMVNIGGKPTIGGVEIDFNKDNYVDIGFGYDLIGGEVDPNTAFKDTYSGVDNFGYGLNSKGLPKNAYSLLGDIVNSLRGGSAMIDRLSDGLDAIPESMEYLLTSIADIGGRTITLENTLASRDFDYVNLAETQGRLEGIDISKEAIFNKSHEMSWMVTLQLGSKVLPQTIFDFIR